MKKVLFLIVMLAVSIVSKAQFEEGKMYLNASLTNLNLKYNGSERLTFGLQGAGSYFIQDNIAITGLVGFEASKANTEFTVGAGARYHIVDNGLFMGAGVKLKLAEGNNDFLPGLEVGYTYFLNDRLVVEPALYYDQSLNSHKDFSTFGLRVGVGIFL